MHDARDAVLLLGVAFVEHVVELLEQRLHDAAQIGSELSGVERQAVGGESGGDELAGGCAVAKILGNPVGVEAAICLVREPELMTFDPSFPMAILESLVREGRTDGAEGGDVLGRALVGPGPEGDGHHGEVIAGDAVGEEVGLDGVAVFRIVDAVGIGEEDAGRVVVAALDEVDAVPAFLERVQNLEIRLRVVGDSGTDDAREAGCSTGRAARAKPRSGSDSSRWVSTEPTASSLCLGTVPRRSSRCDLIFLTSSIMVFLSAGAVWVPAIHLSFFVGNASSCGETLRCRRCQRAGKSFWANGTFGTIERLCR